MSQSQQKKNLLKNVSQKGSFTARTAFAAESDTRQNLTAVSFVHARVFWNWISTIVRAGILLMAASWPRVGETSVTLARRQVLSNLNAGRLSLALQSEGEGHKYKRTNSTLCTEKNRCESDWCHGFASLNLVGNYFALYMKEKKKTKVCFRQKYKVVLTSR